MNRPRIVLVAFVVCVVIVGGFLAGRASAQQVTPHEITAHHQFPRSWGDFRNVVAFQGGYAYFFETADGTIRKVNVADGIGIIEIQVIQRSGTAPRR